MPRWKMPSHSPSKVVCGSLSPRITDNLRRRATNTLRRYGISTTVTSEVTERLIDVVSYAYVARDFVLASEGRGRRVDGPSNLLSLDVEDALKSAGISGNWMLPGDEEADGVIGPVAEIEAIAQAAFRDACGLAKPTAPRPARITDAGKRLGSVTRNR